MGSRLEPPGAAVAVKVALLHPMSAVSPSDVNTTSGTSPAGPTMTVLAPMEVSSGPTAVS